MTPPRTPAGKRDKAVAARRQKILEAAVMCFIENGYHQTGVRDIAVRAGVSLGNLYNHFPGKHDVLIEVARLERRELEPFIKDLGKPGPALKAMNRFVTSYAKYLSAPENVILSIEVASEAIRKEDLGDLFTNNRHSLVVALENLLKRGVASGDFLGLTDTQQAAQMVLELIEGRAYHSVLAGSPMRKMLPGLKAFIIAALGAQT